MIQYVAVSPLDDAYMIPHDLVRLDRILAYAGIQ